MATSRDWAVFLAAVALSRARVAAWRCWKAYPASPTVTRTSTVSAATSRRSRSARFRSAACCTRSATIPASTNAPVSVVRLSRLTGSAAQSLASASWPPRSRAAGSFPASSQARAASLSRRRTRSPSRLASIQVRSSGQAVSRASWVICAVSASTVISRSATKRPSTSPEVAAWPGQSRSSASGTDLRVSGASSAT